MEEKNELNDIILNKGGSNSGSKKLLLAIATFTLILIIVLVIMNSLKNDDAQKAPQAILPPEPTAPTEIINDPLFEPVEVIQEGNETVKVPEVQGVTDLNQVAQKIKNESMQNAPVAQAPVAVAPVVTVPAAKTAVQAAPVAVAAVTQTPKIVAVTPTIKTQPAVKVQKAPLKPVVKQEQVAPVKVAQPKKVVQAAAIAAVPVKTSPKEAVVPVVQTPEVKTQKAPVAQSAATQATYYIQVGSFTNEPNKALFDRLNASGMKYTTQKSGAVTKIMVGPFQGEKSVQDAMGTVRQNIEAKAFKIKG